jgi:hypothetical protein
MTGLYRLALWVLIASAAILPANAMAQSVFIVTETGRGEYEGGAFVADPPQFRYRFEIDEARQRARLTEVVRLSDETVIAADIEYAITAVDDGATLSAYLTSEGRRKQRVLTLVGKPGTLATELILLGETFFEYSKATSGRLYVATGVVRRPVSIEQDTRQQLPRPR